MSGRLFAAIYDPFMRRTEEATFAAWRADLLAGVEGHVLEVGAGTGANVPHYARAGRVTLTEPDAFMRRKLEAKLHGDERFSVSAASVESLPFSSGSFDAVVCTLVLCSVVDVSRALAEVRRVLTPRGRLFFLEHVRAGDPDVAKWQRRIDPLWRRLAGNCHLSRETHALIEPAGFVFESLVLDRARKALPIVRSTARGVAVKA